jgi:hypothetical protein
MCPALRCGDAPLALMISDGLGSLIIAASFELVSAGGAPSVATRVDHHIAALANLVLLSNTFLVLSP